MVIHVVQQGETLWAISQRYGVPINGIVEANKLPNPDVLVVGQALVVPTPPIVHTVQPGDTLWRIAKQYGVTVDLIVEFNNITDPNRLYIGQQLAIPSSPYFTHFVRSGETLWQIAQRYGTTVERLVQINQLSNPSMLMVGQQILVEKVTIEVNGYFTRSGEAAQQRLEILGDYFTYMSMFSYHITADGGLAQASLNENQLLQVAKNQRVVPLMVITNFGERTFSPELAHAVLSNPELQDKLINNILNIMKNKGYSGLNIDFEYVPQADRELYNQFLRKVVDRLHQEGYSVSTAIAPKIREDQKGLLYEAHDYKAHGEIVDFVVIMTYEWGWAGGPPMGIAPINEVRKVLDYAVTVIPPEKILMGVPRYGRDWKLPYERGVTRAATISPQEAIRRAIQYGVPIQYDPLQQSPFFRYIDADGNEHEVWFEDARSLRAKYETVMQYNLRGVSYWEMSTSFPQNKWMLEKYFNIKKLI